ncbi:MAG: S1 RNA-binding domain-containing protein, partial [Terriglobia bacterium]
MSVEENVNASHGDGATHAAQAAAERDALDSPEAGELFDGGQQLPDLAEGKIIRGKVLKVTGDEVLVDIGQKSEGSIPRSEFLGENGSLTVSPGDLV